MNNSFPRLIDGMCATLRTEVLNRLDDEFARGQVFGVINLLNTFKARADWSAGFLLEQIAAQRQALDGVAALIKGSALGGPDGAVPSMPAIAQGVMPASTPVADLLATRDANNRSIEALMQWLDQAAQPLPPAAAAQAHSLLRQAMRAELSIELKNSPRPLFAEMSSGREE